MRRFELLPKVKRFTEPKELKRLHIVVQNQSKVFYSFTGLESMTFMYLWKNMKKKQFALVFDENEKLLGYISLNENGIPQRYQEQQELYFKDMYDVMD